MKCEQQLIQAGLDGRLDEVQSRELAAHVAQCHHCARQWNDHLAIRTALRNQPVPPPSEGFSERTLAPWRSQPKASAKTQGFLAGAIAASLAMWLGLGLPTTPQPGSEPEGSIQAITLSLAQPQQVKLSFMVPTAMTEATIELQLPDGVELLGHPGLQQISWQTNLAPGNNLLTLPLQLNRGSGGSLTARIRHQGQQKAFAIELRTAPPNQTQSVQPSFS